MNYHNEHRPQIIKYSDFINQLKTKMAKTEFKGKPIKIEFGREWMNPKTKRPIYYFKMTVEDVDTNTEYEGEFSTTKKDQNKFVVNEVIDMVREDKESGSGRGYIKFDKLKPQQKDNIAYAKAWKEDPVRQAHILVNVALTGAHRAIEEFGKENDVTSDKQLYAIADKFLVKIQELASGNTQLGITAQSTLYHTLEEIKMSNLNIKSSSDILRRMDEITQWKYDKIKEIIKINQ